MRTNKTVFFILLAVILLSACSKKSVSLEKALLAAGENRVELEKGLAHYQEDPADSLKYRAACFLIEDVDCQQILNSQHLFQENIKNLYLI